MGLVVLAWLLLAGLPFGRKEPARAPAPQTETIAEAPPPASSSTLVEVPPGSADDSFEIATTTTSSPLPAATATEAPPAATATVAPPTATTAPLPTRSTPPPTRSAPPPTRSAPPAAAVRPPPVVVSQPRPLPPPVRVVPPPSRAAEISGDEAAAILRNYVRSTRYYDVAGECIRVENRGYRNVGFNLEVWHSCAGGGASRLLGRWRVDSKTREVFRQREDGRYLRP
ncbi:MAG TPA: hypothetical protein VM733_04110 [Thermoanaerobaculia bacterium]|nr:hypothetical protein [Thermoanaerobaculia bacterium]